MYSAADMFIIFASNKKDINKYIRLFLFSFWVYIYFPHSYEMKFAFKPPPVHSYIFNPILGTYKNTNYTILFLKIKIQSGKKNNKLCYWYTIVFYHLSLSLFPVHSSASALEPSRNNNNIDQQSLAQINILSKNT